MEIDRHVRNAGIWGSGKNLTAVLLGILLLAAACLGGCRNSQDMFVRIPEESLPAGQESSQAESPETGMEPGTTETSDTKPSEEITQESENPPQKETNVPAASGTQELNGSIQSVGSYGFTVYQIFNEQQEDGGMIAYSSKEKIPWWTSALQSGLFLPSPLPQTEGLPHPALREQKLIWKYPAVHI